jgi:hypothetical protein
VHFILNSAYNFLGKTVELERNHYAARLKSSFPNIGAFVFIYCSTNKKPQKHKEQITHLKNFFVFLRQKEKRTFFKTSFKFVV